MSNDIKEEPYGRHDYRETWSCIKNGWFEETAPWTLDRFVIYRVRHDNPGEYNRPMKFVPKGHVMVEAVRASDGASMIDEILTLDEYAALEPLHNNGPPRVFPLEYIHKRVNWKTRLPVDHRWRKLWYLSSE
tara:strand:- start:98 stop:493 length:396 start_codon:yes stop_codon:yes gene_type:complete